MNMSIAEHNSLLEHRALSGNEVPEEIQISAMCNLLCHTTHQLHPSCLGERRRPVLTKWRTGSMFERLSTTCPELLSSILLSSILTSPSSVLFCYIVHSFSRCAQWESTGATTKLRSGLKDTRWVSERPLSLLWLNDSTLKVVESFSQSNDSGLPDTEESFRPERSFGSLAQNWLNTVTSIWAVRRFCKLMCKSIWLSSGKLICSSFRFGQTDVQSNVQFNVSRSQETCSSGQR